MDNAATEQVFGHLKDEFYVGHESHFTSFEQFRKELGDFIHYWNFERRQEAIGGYTPEEYRKIALIS